MQIVSYPIHYQSVCTNFYFSSFSRISCCLKDAILQYKIPAISQEIKEKIISIIESNSKTLEKGATCEHKYNALRKQYDSQNKIQHGVCPRCGGRLVERQGRYGFFFGCSNYPRCKFTSNR